MKNIREEMYDNMNEVYWKFDMAVTCSMDRYRALDRVCNFFIWLPYK